MAGEITLVELDLPHNLGPKVLNTMGPISLVEMLAEIAKPG